MFKRFSKNRYGYSRWDGTQSIEGLDADDILNALSDEYLENSNLQQALKRLMQEGIRTDDGRRTMGLRELMERMRNQRNQQLNRYNMASGVMDDLREKLEEIKQMEREGIQRRLDDPDQSQAQQPTGPESPPSADEQGEQRSPANALTPEQQERLQQLRERFKRELEQKTVSPSDQQPGAPQEGQSQAGQMGESGQSPAGSEASPGDDLTTEQKRRMLEMIAK